MKSILLILIGWLLGILSPRIVDIIKLKYKRRELAAAMKSEFEDLQYRMAITSLLIAEKYEIVTKDYLLWIKPILTQYKGNEPVESIKNFIIKLIELPEDQLMGMIEYMKASDGSGINLKKFSVGLVEANLGILTGFPIEYQKRIHEFRNQLSILNQEIALAIDRHRMTFDSTISIDNHERLKNNLIENYKTIYRFSNRVANTLQSLINYDISKIS